jgi:flagellar basal body rod protein FlgG
MSTTLYVSGVGAKARLAQLEILANNLANADTTGFKADGVLFESALEAALADEAGRAVGAGLAFVSTGGVRANHEQGPILSTGGPLDVAIEGPGFFQVQTPDGVRYTRAGAFRVDPRGQLVGPGHHPVVGAGGPIVVGREAARIDATGRVLAPDGRELGRLAVEEFLEPELLVREGSSLYRAPIDAVGLPVEELRLATGAIEQSNVKPTHELTQLVILQRAFEASLQALETDDAASRRLIEEVSS